MPWPPTRWQSGWDPRSTLTCKPWASAPVTLTLRRVSMAGEVLISAFVNRPFVSSMEGGLLPDIFLSFLDKDWHCSLYQETMCSLGNNVFSREHK